MAAGLPAVCKQGRSSSSVPSYCPFSSSAPRLLSLSVLLASLSLLPVGWSSGIVVRSAGTGNGDLGDDGSPQLLAYRPLTTEQGTTGDGAFVFRKFCTISCKLCSKCRDKCYIIVLKIGSNLLGTKV